MGLKQWGSAMGLRAGSGSSGGAGGGFVLFRVFWGVLGGQGNMADREPEKTTAPSMHWGNMADREPLRTTSPSVHRGQHG